MSKTEKVIDYLCQQVVTGRLRPGDRIPTRLALEQMLNVSNGPVESAMMILKAEGLLRGERGKGVFIAELTDGPGVRVQPEGVPYSYAVPMGWTVHGQ